MGSKAQTEFDVAIVGGGPSACAIARDAVGRGLRVLLCAPGDFGGAVEQTIVAEALALNDTPDPKIAEESAVMQRICPQINFHKFPTTEKSSFLRRLFGQKSNPSCLVSPANAHRFSILNARDAAERGAVLLPQTKVHDYVYENDLWTVRIGDLSKTIQSRVLVDTLPSDSGKAPSQFAKVALFDRGGNVESVLIQTETGSQFCVEFCDKSAAFGVVSNQEPSASCLEQLAKDAGFTDPPFWVSETFVPNPNIGCGLHIETDPPLFRISGVRSYEWRIFAEQTVAEMAPFVRMIGKRWTRYTSLPGGDFQPVIGYELLDDLRRSHPEINDDDLSRLFKSYGTECHMILNANAGLGTSFGQGLYEAEVRWLMDKELASSADDIIWRRTLLGMHMPPAEIAGLKDWLADHKP